jgi:Zn-dependent M16 (insulinase) family peptidase
VKSNGKWQSKKFTEPIREARTYPAGADQEATNMFMMNWLINDRPLSTTEDLTLCVLDHLLMGTTSSILRKTLMESGLGEAITGGGLSDELLQATYSVGLKGAKEENMAKAEQLILNTFAKVEKEGFTSDDIEASLNPNEFQMREFNTGSFPRYLSFMLAANSIWIYDESPMNGLKFEKTVGRKSRNRGIGIESIFGHGT